METKGIWWGGVTLDNYGPRVTSNGPNPNIDLSQQEGVAGDTTILLLCFKLIFVMVYHVKYPVLTSNLSFNASVLTTVYFIKSA